MNIIVFLLTLLVSCTAFIGFLIWLIGPEIAFIIIALIAIIVFVLGLARASTGALFSSLLLGGICYLGYGVIF